MRLRWSLGVGAGGRWGRGEGGSSELVGRVGAEMGVLGWACCSLAWWLRLDDLDEIGWVSGGLLA